MAGGCLGSMYWGRLPSDTYVFEAGDLESRRLYIIKRLRNRRVFEVLKNGSPFSVLPKED